MLIQPARRLVSWRLPIRNLHMAGGASRAAGVALALLLGLTAVAAAAQPKNIILMISDGQGYNHVEATDLYNNAAASYESFPVQYGVSTYPLNASLAPTGGEVPQFSYNPAAYWSNFSYPLTGWTDSAAAATAMASGVKSYNSSINWDNDPATTGKALTGIFEIAKAKGKATGVVTSVEWSHATPAAFGAHNISRNNYAGIANEMLTSGKLDVIMGAGNPAFTDNGAAYASTITNTRAQYVGGLATWNALTSAHDSSTTYQGFTPIFSKTEFDNLANNIGTLPAKVVGTAQVNTTLQQARSGDAQVVNFANFNTNVPSAATMATAALNVLDQNPNGFFCMMETGGAVDWAAGQKGRTIEEETGFNNSVDAVLSWLAATGHDADTLLIVTADHETGQLWGNDAAYLVPGAAAGYNNLNPNLTGSSVLGNMLFSNGGGHTNALVPLYATGPGSELFAQYATGTDSVRGAYISNTDIFNVMNTAAVPEPAALALLSMGLLLAMRRARIPPRPAKLTV